MPKSIMGWVKMAAAVAVVMAVIFRVPQARAAITGQ